MAGRITMGSGGGNAASFKDAFFRNFFISMLDSSPIVKWDPSDDTIDKSFFMSLLEDRNSNRPTVGMVMAAIIATGNKKDYYSKIVKWIRKQPSAEPNQLVIKQFDYIMKLAEYIIKTVSKTDVEYWKKLLVEAWYKSPQREDDLWPMIFGNYWPNSKKLSIIGKDSVYVQNKEPKKNGNKEVNPDEAAFQDILNSHTSSKKTVGIVLEAIIAAKQNHQRYINLIEWIGKITPPKLNPALAKQFLHYRKLSDYLATDLSERESQYWGEILGSTEYQLPQDTKDIWPSIFGNAIHNFLTLSFVGKSHVYKRNPSALPPKKYMNTQSAKGNIQAPPPPAIGDLTVAKENVKAAAAKPARVPITAPTKTEKSPAPKPEKEKPAPSSEDTTANEESEEANPMFDEEYFNTILKGNNAKTKSVATVLAAIISANEKEDRYEKVIKWIGKTKPPKLNRAITEQFLMYRNLSEYLTKSVPAEDTPYWLELLRDTEYQLPLSGTEIWPCIFGKAVPNVLDLAITYEGQVYKKGSDSVSGNEAPKAETGDPKAETDSPVKGGKHIQVALVGDSHIFNLPCKMEETFECEFGSYTLKKYCDKKARPDYFHNTKAWNQFKVTRPNVVILFLGGANIQKLPNAKSLANAIIWYERQILQHTNVRDDRFFIIGLEKRKSSPVVYWDTYRNSVNNELTKHFGDKNFFIFDQDDNEIDADGKNMSKEAYSRLLEIIKDASISVLQYGEEFEFDTVDANVSEASEAETKVKADVPQTPKAETKAKVTNVQQTPKAETKAKVANVQQTTPKSETKAKVANVQQTTPKSETKRKVDDNVQQADAKKVKTSNTSPISYNKSPQKRQQPEQGNQANAKKLATEKKAVIYVNEVDDEFQNLLNKTVGPKPIAAVLEAVDAAKGDKIRYHHILKWIGVSRFMTPVLEKQLSMYCKLSEYLQETLPQTERDYWNKTLSETVYQPPTKPFEDVWDNIFGKATPNIHRITVRGKEKIYKRERPGGNVNSINQSSPKATGANISKASPAKSNNINQSQPKAAVTNVSKDSSAKSVTINEAQPKAAVANVSKASPAKTVTINKPQPKAADENVSKASPPKTNINQSNTKPAADVSKSSPPKNAKEVPTKEIPATDQNSNNSEKQITVTMIGDSSIASFPGNPTEIIKCPAGSYTLKRFCKTGELIDNFPKIPEWNKLIGSNADIVLVSLGGDSLKSFTERQAKAQTVSDKLLQRRREIMKAMKLSPKCVYLVGLGKKKSADKYWEQLRTEVNQFLVKVLTKKQFFLPEDLQLDAVQPNINKTVYENLQKFIQQAYDNLKDPFSAQTCITTIQKETHTPGKQTHGKPSPKQGNFNKNWKQNGKAASIVSGTGDLRNLLRNNDPAKQQRKAPIQQRKAPIQQRKVPILPSPRQSSAHNSAHNYLKNFGKTQTGGLDQSDLRNSIGMGRDVRSRLGGIVTNNQDLRNQFGGGKQQGNRNQLGGAGGQDLRSLIARGQAGRQVHF